MKDIVKEIREEYLSGINYKSSLGVRGMFEQNRMNERFYIGDQWHAAGVGNTRPLVRHNIIKQIGKHKIGKIMSKDVKVSFYPSGIPEKAETDFSVQKELLTGKLPESDNLPENNELNLIGRVLTSLFESAKGDLNMNGMLENLLKESFITGTGILYSHWNKDNNNELSFTGDIEAELLASEDVYFGDNSEVSVEKQPYIIIASKAYKDDLISEATKNGIGKAEREKITSGVEKDGKITVLTKFFKQKDEEGKTRVYAVKTTKNALIKDCFDTGISRYPITVFVWEQLKNRVFGESEVTNLIPNQIAINRMITASVWASMSMGMPIMTVNGDTVSCDITNDPGQIIKIYGSNDDVKNAVNYVTPPDFTGNFQTGITSLIEETISSSGVSDIIYSKVTSLNTSAINAAKESDDVSLVGLKNRYIEFIKNVADLWCELWMSRFLVRRVKMTDKDGVWYASFSPERYKNIKYKATVSYEKGEENER